MARLGEYGEKLEQMSAQEVLDVAVEHLLTQAEVSRLPGSYSCRYDGPNGICCAAAPFLKYYIPDFEGSIYQGLEGQPTLHLNLIQRLQQVHDESSISRWPEDLTEVAKKFELDSSMIDKLEPGFRNILKTRENN